MEMNRGWRSGAWIALVAVFLRDLWDSFPLPAGHLPCAVVAAVVAFAAFASALVLMPESVDVLWRNRALLTPLALVIVAFRVLGWLAGLPAIGSVLTPSIPIKVATVSVALSGYVAIGIVLHVLYAAWTTRTLVDLVRRGTLDLSRSWHKAVRRLWPVFFAEAAALATILIGCGVALLFLPSLGGVALIPMLILALVINFTTAAALPVACEGDFGALRTLKTGLAVSVANLGQWWILVLLQMLILGAVTFFFRSTFNGSNIDWGVNAFWTGAYEDESRWYTKAIAAFGTARVPIVASLLQFVLAVFAVALKLAIVQRMPPLVQPNETQPVTADAVR